MDWIKSARLARIRIDAPGWLGKLAPFHQHWRSTEMCYIEKATEPWRRHERHKHINVPSLTGHLQCPVIQSGNAYGAFTLYHDCATVVHSNQERMILEQWPG